jgi:hypothetical protein
MVSDQVQPCPDHQMPKQPIVVPSIKKKEINVKRLFFMIGWYFANMLNREQKEYV